MRQVNIYTMTDVKSVSHTSGHGIYILEYVSPSGKKATCTKTVELDAHSAKGATIYTVTQAVKRIREQCELEIHISEGFIAAAFSRGWINDWQRNDWHAQSGKEIADKELWQELLYVLTQHNVRITYDAEHEYASWMENELRRIK